MNNYYWYFASNSKRLRHGDGRLIEVGITHKVEPPLELCKRGLHASERAIDALRYAPGPIVCRVELGGEVVSDKDKACATERTYLSMVDAEATLRAFARRCALDVIDLWDAPGVVREYLETGDEEIGADARYAARNSAARYAARAAAQAARYAARAAARYAVWSASRDAALVARYAAWDAAYNAASYADGSAARTEKTAQYNEWLEEMLLELEEDKNE